MYATEIFRPKYVAASVNLFRLRKLAGKSPGIMSTADGKNNIA